MVIQRFKLFFLLLCVAGISVSASTHDDDHVSLFEQYQKLSPEQLQELCTREHIDVTELQEIIREECTPTQEESVPEIEFTRQGFSGVAIASAAPSLDALIDEQKLVLNADGYIEWQTAAYTSPQIATIPEPTSPFITAGGKIARFLETKVSGKRIEVVAMVAYISYRQLMYLYQQHITELCARSPLKKEFEPTYTETILSIMGFNSRAVAYTDFMIRASFCSMRMWLDLNACVKTFKRYEWLQDPEGYLRTIKFYVERARLLFTDPLYYGSNMSLIKKVLIGLAVPFAWAGLFSQNSPGAPLKNQFFINALSHTTTVLAQEGGMQAQIVFDKKAKPSLQKKLFNYSGGVVRERLFLDVALWAGQYANKKYVQKEKVSPGAFFGRKAGEYAIRHMYLQGLIYVISQAFRGGALQACGWMGDKIGWMLSKLGFFKENPATTSRTMLHKKCKDMGLLHEDQALIEVLIYPACVFPGAFARAVRGVISKQIVGPVLAKDPGFISCLNEMHGMSVLDLLRAMAVNFMAPQQMSARIHRVKNAVSPQQWRKIMNKFLNELILEIFFDRRRMLCQVITEPILSVLSAPILSALYARVLPDQK